MFKHDQTTERENYSLLLDGKIPEWVPNAEMCYAGCVNSFLLAPGKPIYREETKAEWRDHEFYDAFGIDTLQPDPNIGPMPNAAHYAITDIIKWKEQIPPMPDLKSMDWEALAAQDTAHLTDEVREERYVEAMFWAPGGIPFTNVVSYMGHQEALISLLAEPEAFAELANFNTDWNIELIQYTAKYYKPDIICFCDDLANKQTTFMSPETYRELIKPCQKRLVDAIVDAGCIPYIHCCGHAESIVGDFVDVGLRAWNPAQVMNDLVKVKAEYGDKLIIDGGVDTQGPMNRVGASEEEVRASVRESIDKYAPGGGYVFDTSGMVLEYKVGKEHCEWIRDEANSYGADFYKSH